MGHTLTIGVAKAAQDGDDRPGDRIISCRKVALRERVLRFLLGEKRRLTILVPGDSVKTLSIVEEGGCLDEPDE